MRSFAVFTILFAVFLGFFQVALAAEEDPVVVFETVHSTSIKTALVTSTGTAPPNSEATAVKPGRVIKVFTIAPEGQVLAALGPTANGTTVGSPTVTGSPSSGNGTNTAITTPTTSPVQDSDDEKDSGSAMQMASIPLLVSVMAAAFAAIAL